MASYIMSKMKLPNGTEQDVFYQREICTNEDGLSEPMHIMRIGSAIKKPGPVKFISEIILSPEDVSKLYLLMTNKGLNQVPDIQHPIYIGIHLDREHTCDSIKISKIGSPTIPKKDYQYIIEVDKAGKIIDHTTNGKQFESAVKFVKVVIDAIETNPDINMEYVVNHCIEYNGETPIDKIKETLKSRK